MKSKSMNRVKKPQPSIFFFLESKCQDPYVNLSKDLFFGLYALIKSCPPLAVYRLSIIWPFLGKIRETLI